jgi:hypothetical protein
VRAMRPNVMICSDRLSGLAQIIVRTQIRKINETKYYAQKAKPGSAEDLPAILDNTIN